LEPRTKSFGSQINAVFCQHLLEALLCFCLFFRNLQLATSPLYASAEIEVIQTVSHFVLAQKKEKKLYMLIRVGRVELIWKKK